MKTFESIANRKTSKIYFDILKLALKRYFRNYQRVETDVKKEYTKIWAKGLSSLFTAPHREFYHGNLVIVRGIDSYKYAVNLIANEIRELKPNTVLEVGSGGGINLFTLAVMFPEINFTGIELTEAGVLTAKASQNAPPPQRIRVLNWGTRVRNKKRH